MPLAKPAYPPPPPALRRWFKLAQKNSRINMMAGAFLFGRVQALRRRVRSKVHGWCS